MLTDTPPGDKVLLDYSGRQTQSLRKVKKKKKTNTHTDAQRCALA